MAGTSLAQESFHRVELKEGYVREFGETCPIRLEIPVGVLFKDGVHGKLTTVNAAGATCHGAYLAKLKLQLEPGKWIQRTKSVGSTAGSHIVIDADYGIGEGIDNVLTVVYRLVQGDREIASATQSIDAAALRRYKRSGKARLFEPAIARSLRDDDVNPVELLGFSMDSKALDNAGLEPVLRVEMTLER